MGELLKLHSVLKDVPLSKMRLAERSQRTFRPGRADFLVREFDPEMFGLPVVSDRGGHFFIVDGQHRIYAVKVFIGDGWEKQSVTCRVYSGLTEETEADMFDRLNNMLTVSAFDKFRVRVTAGRPTELAVYRAVEKAGLKVSQDYTDGSVAAVSTLVKVYERSDAATLTRTLRLVNNSFGNIGLTKEVIDGVGRVCARYNGALDDKVAVEKLQTLRGGVGQLMAKAHLLRNQTRQAMPECVAAAIVDVVNAKVGTGKKKLPAWWKEQ